MAEIDSPPKDRDETDTQKLANDMGLDKGSAKKPSESDDEPQLDFYGQDKEPEQIVDEPDMIDKEEDELDQMI